MQPAPAAANPMDDERRRRAVEAAKAQLAASLGNSAPTSEPPAPPKVKEPEAVKVEEAISKPAPAPMAPQEVSSRHTRHRGKCAGFRGFPLGVVVSCTEPIS